MITLVVFDMAGTTIDEHGDVYRALARTVEETGASITDDDVQRWMGADKREAIAALIEIGGGVPDQSVVDAAFDRFRAVLLSLYSSNPPAPLPGIPEALQELKTQGIKTALTTGFSRDVTELLLKGLGWQDVDFLDTVICSDEVPMGRPAPYMIHRAMEVTGVISVSEVLSAGDTVNDLLAARNAGVTGVGVLTGGLNRAELEQYPHECIVDSAADVPALVKSRS
ncbi:phosphonatase-like hydrolase [Arthrobacter castelli]|uniref:phosphonatase-like hydrolase n=1 Tax=Arthrobacter castelli TaxID=271431 RepID=UPI0003FA288F|nr:phosphonatase-like hydrolase [Arthrobacter castelli]